MPHHLPADPRRLSPHQQALLAELEQLEQLRRQALDARRQVQRWARTFRHRWSRVEGGVALVLVTGTHVVAAEQGALRCRAVLTDGSRCAGAVWAPADGDRRVASGVVVSLDESSGLEGEGISAATEGLCRQLCPGHLQASTVVTTEPAHTVVLPRHLLADDELPLLLGRGAAAPPAELVPASSPFGAST